MSNTRGRRIVKQKVRMSWAQMLGQAHTAHSDKDRTLPGKARRKARRMSECRNTAVDSAAVPGGYLARVLCECGDEIRTPQPDASEHAARRNAEQLWRAHRDHKLMHQGLFADD